MFTNIILQIYVANQNKFATVQGDLLVIWTCVQFCLFKELEGFKVLIL